jgi:hypothetical protein
MYLTHGQSAWFRERYSTEPRYATMRKRLHRQGRVPTVEKYIAEVREGKWDEVCYDLSGAYSLKCRTLGLTGQITIKRLVPHRQIRISPRAWTSHWERMALMTWCRVSKQLPRASKCLSRQCPLRQSDWISKRQASSGVED